MEGSDENGARASASAKSEILIEIENIVKEIEKMVRNFNKDGPNRKTKKYLEKRLEQINELKDKAALNNQRMATEGLGESQKEAYLEQYSRALKLTAIMIESIGKGLSQIEILRTDNPNIPPDSITLDLVNKNKRLTEKDKKSDRSFFVENEEEEEDDANLKKLVKTQEGLIINAYQQAEKLDEKVKLTKSQIDYKINRLKKTFERIEDVDMEIWALASSSECFGYKHQMFFDVADLVENIVIYYNDELKEEKEKMTPQKPLMLPKLPEIPCPVFQGDFKKWLNFEQLFKELIDNRTDIGKISKMMYLQGNCKGEPYNLIKNMPLTEENYEACLKILIERYNNRRLIANAHFEFIFDRPAIVEQTAKGLKSLHDDVNESIQALNQMGFKIDEWDSILQFLITRKLDEKTRLAYEIHLGDSKEIPPLNKLMSFLRSQFNALESFENTLLETTSSSGSSSSKRNTLIATRDTCTLGCNEIHLLHLCPKFKELSVADRYDHVKAHFLCLNCLRPNHKVQTCKFSPCLKCRGKHSTWLHIERPTREQTIEPQSTLTTTKSSCSSTYVILATSMVTITHKDSQRKVVCRAILDSASQLNFISSNIYKKLGVSGANTKVEIEGIGKARKDCEMKTDIKVCAASTDFAVDLADVMVLNSITSNQPSINFDINEFEIPSNTTLADEEFYKPKEVGLLLGAGVVAQTLLPGNFSLGDKKPFLQNTKFGWVVLGELLLTQSSKHFCGVVSQPSQQFDDPDLMKHVWKLDYGEGFSKVRMKENLLCEKFFDRNYKRDIEGKFVVRLPFKKDPSLLGNSESQALRRYFSMERKLLLNNEIKEEYYSFMKTYLDLGHMEELRCPRDIGHKKYYLPHHYVLKPESSTTKLRVVFDATSITSTGLSLNDILAKGPKLQRDLFDILISFRSYRYALCADIKMMFRQVVLDPLDQNYQLIFFRFSKDTPVKTYKLKTVTYGTSSAPYLSVKCLQMLALENKQKYPLASRIILDEFYMDDMLSGSNSLDELKKVRKEIVEILASGGFHLRKWASNESRILDECNECEEANKCLKVLGVAWDTAKDEFLVRLGNCYEESNIVTKRYILTKISEVFDPLGLLNPVLVEGRLFLQDLWEAKVSWDEVIEGELLSRWIRFYEGLKLLKGTKIPRQLFLPQASSIELHAFCDASSIAYGAVIFSRSVSENNIFTNIICSKSRIVSLKKRKQKISMPRLELCAAVLLVELVDKVVKSINTKFNSIYYYTDSTTVIHWIHKNCQDLKSFESRRVSTIQRLSSPNDWNYIKSKNNPADLISRGVSPKKFLSSDTWFLGPEFLRKLEIIHDTFPHNPSENKEDGVIAMSLLITKKRGILELNINHKNNFEFLLGIVSNIVKFIYTKCNRTLDDNLSWREKAEELLVGCMQAEFEEERIALDKKEFVKSSSKLKTLSPFIDRAGLIRVGGRISKAKQLDFTVKHPWVLSYSHPYTYLLVKHLHQKYLHATPQALLYIVRQNYWPLRGRLLTRCVVNHCYRCFLFSPRSFEQIMGNLPSDRLLPQRPFLICGIDYIGPMKIHHNMRGKRPTKCYVSVFICFVTKAIHIEIVSDLTANAFIAAFKRMVGRRGCPSRVYSDNGSNFKCAAREIELNIQSFEFNQFITTRAIEWNFIPARSPHMGGIWESAVKSIKQHYEKVVQFYTLTFEELQTVMVEIESILNSRPLTPMSDDPRDLQVLTPGHFLIGEPFTTLPDRTNVKVVDVRKNWLAITELKNVYWKRWSDEYLTELQKRYKWYNKQFEIEPGTLVLLKDDDTKPLNWKRGRVISCVKGDDDHIRVVNVKTENGVTSRTVHKICPIPTEEPIPTIQFEKVDKVEIRNDNIEDDNTMARNISNSVIPKKCLLNILLIAILFLPLVVSNPMFKDISDNSGIFFEDLGESRIVLSKFNIIAFFDLDHYWVARDGIKSAIVQHRLICHLADKNFENLTDCHVIIEQLSRRWDQSEKIHKYIFRENRKKRALLKFAGTILHDVIGIMDEDTAKEYDKRIEENADNQNFIINNMKKIAVLHNSTMNIIEENNQKILERLSKINSDIIRVTTALDVIDFRNFIMTSLLAMEEFKDLQLGIWEALRDVHTGIFNPIIIQPEQLVNLIDKVRSELPSILTFPSSNIFDLMSFLKIKAHATQNNVIFEIEIPLVGTETFTMLQIHPFPIIHKDYLVSIIPSIQYFLINNMKDRYIEIRNEDHFCTKTNKIWMCAGVNEIHHTEDLRSCEISQYIHSTTSDSLKYCPIQVAFKRLFIRQLNTPNHWLIVQPEDSTADINCHNVHTKIKLRGRGVLIGEKGCQIRTSSTTLLSYEDSTRNLTFLKSEVDLSLLLKDEKKVSLLNTSDLQYGPLKLHELPKAPSPLELELPKHDIHQFVVSYTSLIAVFVILGVVIYLIRRYSWISSLIPIPAPRRVSNENEIIYSNAAP